jgi:hypothetical protein
VTPGKTLSGKATIYPNRLKRARCKEKSAARL